MDNKKEIERAELHKAIWKIANDLRGQVDGWEFKNFVLGTMFYRYISEHITSWWNENEQDSDPNFDYANYDDKLADEEFKEASIEEIGFYIKPSHLFANVRKNERQNENLNTLIANIFKSIEDSSKGTSSEEDFKGLFDDFDVNNIKLGTTVAERNNKIIKLLDGIGDMRLGEFSENTIDAFGDAYEFLMGMYASDAGKSGGEYYTPQEVGQLLVKLAIKNKTKINKIYDMCCGSGSLLLQAIKLLGIDKVNGFYGQEVNPTTYNLCRINMFLHKVPFNQFHIALGDTLKGSVLKDEGPFDVIVSNPPYSLKWDGNKDITLIQDERYAPAGALAPRMYADLAFVMHAIHYLSSDGIAAIVLSVGVLHRAREEQKIRKYLIEKNLVDAIIQLPQNLFFGTSIATSILVLNKAKKDTNIQFIDASNEFVKVKNNNKLSQENIDKILNTYLNKEVTKHFSNIVPQSQVIDKKYNLSVSNYVEPKDTKEPIDIQVLNKEIAEIVAKQEKLREEISKIIEEIEGFNN
ncbi:type I restriction-modification system subunit M [Mycoplasma sp. 128]|uniref:type I restriction-modification system subunit M n=1 Tax=Mycoplasma sp. 3341 TaxID=3447506 RepID=UPI003F659FCE